MLKEFKEFAMKGNLIEVAVGLVLALSLAPLRLHHREIAQPLEESLSPPLTWWICGRIRVAAASPTEVETMFARCWRNQSRGSC